MGMFKFNSLNLFKKVEGSASPNQEITPAPLENNADLVEKEKTVVPQKFLDKECSLEEKFQVMAQKKEEIKELYRNRQEFYIQNKQLEEKMLTLGLSEDAQKKIKEKIMTEGGEFADKIKEIRDEYNFVPTAEEVLGVRFAMLEAEMKRLEENLMIKYKKIQERLKSFAEYVDRGHFDIIEGNNIRFRNNEHDLFLAIVNDLKRKYDNELNFDFVDDHLVDRNKFEEFIKNLNKKIQESTTYKTPGETEDALRRRDKVSSLLIDVDSKLREVKSKGKNKR